MRTLRARRVEADVQEVLRAGSRRAAVAGQRDCRHLASISDHARMRYDDENDTQEIFIGTGVKRTHYRRRFDNAQTAA